MCDDDLPLIVGDYDAERVAPWIDYLYGRWELGLPDAPGTYAVATLEGVCTGYRHYVVRGGRVVDPQQGHSEPGWVGWRWSVSLPWPPREVP